MSTKSEDEGCVLIIAFALVGVGAGCIWGWPVGCLVVGGFILAVAVLQ